MWRRKKFIVIALLAVVILAGSIGGFALAQTGDDDGSQPQTLMARVAEILGIEQQELEDAFDQAQSDMRDEALDNYLQKLVEEEKITEEEAKQYKEWWQAKPDMTPFQQARPDIGGGFGFRGHGGFRGMGGMRGFHMPCPPTDGSSQETS